MRKGFKIIYSINNEEMELQLACAYCINDEWSYYIDGVQVTEREYEEWIDDVMGNLHNSIYRSYHEVYEDD